METELGELKDIVILYHGHCYDGFAAAWSAHKKFGDTASYIPSFHTEVDKYPKGVENKEVYVVDFCFSEGVTKALEDKNKKLVVLDHHISARTIVESLPNHIFSETDSGAKIAWKYFHSDTAVPQLIEYISDGDTWAHALPSWMEVENFIYAHELNFDSFDELGKLLEEKKDEVVETGGVLAKQFNKLVEEHIDKAMLVLFEGYTVYACNASSFLRSELGHRLAKKKGPFSIIYRFEKDVLRVSLRGDGSIDVTEITKKYGGGGHKNAGAMIFEKTTPLPFVVIAENQETKAGQGTL